MKKQIKTTGIVIRKCDFGEADRIVTVLTDDYGKIDLLAKGARRLKSKFCGRLELFNEIDLSGSAGRELHYLDEADLIKAYPEEKNVGRHRILFYLAELTNRLIPSGQQAEGAYPLLQETLYHLQKTDRLETILHAYLIKLLTFTGFLSPWNKCGICDASLNLDDPICLHATDGHLLCPDCQSPADRPLSVPLIKWVNFMQQYPLPDTLRVSVKEEDSQSVWIWLQSILENLLSSPLKSEAFLKA
ncbi:DNA repair protein RecO [Candidatus Peregrinibacteria bacterium]|nr:DNA repair protein RecO [Candidatus Peregrinibacteria bacterium]